MLKRSLATVLACLIVATVAFSVGASVQGGDVPPPPIGLLDEVSERSGGTQPGTVDRERRAERTRDRRGDHGERRAAASRARRGRRRADSGRAAASDRAGGRRYAPATVSPRRGGARPAADDDDDQGAGGGTSDDDEPSRTGVDDGTDAGQDPVEQGPRPVSGDDEVPDGGAVDGTDDDDQPDGGSPGDDLDD